MWPQCMRGHTMGAQYMFVKLTFKAWRVTRFGGKKDGVAGFPHNELARRVLPFVGVQLIGCDVVKRWNPALSHVTSLLCHLEWL